MEFVKEFNKLESPIGEYPFYLLLETSGSNEEHDLEKLNSFLEAALNKHLILNGTVAHEYSKIAVRYFYILVFVVLIKIFCLI